MAHERCWCRAAVVADDGKVLARFEVRGTDGPDLSDVDQLARLALGSARNGGTLLLYDVVPSLRELLQLAGLWVEVEGEPESGEEPLSLQVVQEEAERGDPSL